jgi:8-oxo-dGTP diphosphatase
LRAQRPAARLLVTDPEGRLLMFRFNPADRPAFWCTPGGALDPGESYFAAAIRELREETGFIVDDPGPVITVRHARFITLEGVDVDAEEHYYSITTSTDQLDISGHTALEQAVMQAHHWFTPAELAALDEPFFPEDLADLWATLRAPV